MIQCRFSFANLSPSCCASRTALSTRSRSRQCRCATQPGGTRGGSTSVPRCAGTPDEMTALTIELVKAGIPEPNTSRPAPCPCLASRPGVHDLIDRLRREQIDLLLDAVLRANRPKDEAVDRIVQGATSTPTSRSHGSFFWGFLWRQR